MMTFDLIKWSVILASARNIDGGRGVVPRHSVAENSVFSISDRLGCLKSIEGGCMFGARHQIALGAEKIRR